MERQHVTRRIVLSAVVVGLVFLGLGAVDSTLAAVKGGDYGSKDNMKVNCELNGGTFIDSPQDGLTACFHTDGSKDVCDQNGGDCYYYPPPPKKLVDTGSAHPIVADAPLVAEDSQTVAPVYAPLEVIAEAPLEAAVEAPVTLTEEPMAAEAGAEQP